jgi:alpha-pyrone synthase
MSFVIRGLGTAVPSMKITSADALACARALGGPDLAGARWLNAVYQRSGVATRHQVLGQPLVDDLLAGTQESGSAYLPGHPRGPTTEQRMAVYKAEAPALGLQAAKKALVESGLDPQRITHLVTVSCTGFAAPGLDYHLMTQLHLSPTVQRVHVGFMGCHGALNGLRVANAFTGANPDAEVLLVAVELCSLHYDYGSIPEKMIANALFADGAAAVVGTGAGNGWTVTDTGSCLIPDSANEMAWDVGDHGFDMLLTKHIPRLIGQHLRVWLESWLATNNLGIADVGSWAIHPGGPRILTAVEETLGLNAEQMAPSRGVLHDYGNMSSPTVLFITERLRRDGGQRPLVLLAFGPGLIAEAALVV